MKLMDWNNRNMHVFFTFCAVGQVIVFKYYRSKYIIIFLLFYVNTIIESQLLGASGSMASPIGVNCEVEGNGQGKAFCINSKMIILIINIFNPMLVIVSIILSYVAALV